MSDMPKPVETIGAWQMERWEYDDAPLEARRPAERYRDEMTAEIDKVGDLEIRVDTREGNVCVCVPRDVLVALLRDGVARGVLAEPSMTVAQVDAMEREYVATFLGGYHDAAQIQIFRHGMATVFNGLRASNVSPTPARSIAAPGLDLPARVAAAVHAEADSLADIAQAHSLGATRANLYAIVDRLRKAAGAHTEPTP